MTSVLPPGTCMSIFVLFNSRTRLEARSKSEIVPIMSTLWEPDTLEVLIFVLVTFSCSRLKLMPIHEDPQNTLVSKGLPVTLRKTIE